MVALTVNYVRASMIQVNNPEVILYTHIYIYKWHIEGTLTVI